jgi:outer membrane protein insertion porin family
VGPVEVIRRRCDPRSPPGECRPLPLPHAPSLTCGYDATNLPLPEARQDPRLTCVPDRAHGVTCESRLWLRIPIKLGPHTTLYDMGFRGVRSIVEKKLGEAAKLSLGTEVSSQALEEARRRVLDTYREEGFAYADVKVSLDESLDHTRGRATFEVVEGDRVIVDKIIIRGNDLTSDGVIRRRVALAVGQPYRTSLARRTQQQISTLNVFATVNVSLENAYLPMPRKTVVITVVEQKSQYVDTTGGLSSGEGIRINLEYGNRNILGNAIGFALHARLSYLPDFLILDPQVKANFDTLGNPGFGARLAGRLTGTFTFPDIGLGPLIRASVDAIGVRDLERDFYLTKAAMVLNGYYRPFRQLQFTLSPDVEFNDVGLFQGGTLAAYIASQGGGTELSTLLREPQGTSYAIAQRFIVTWDRRDAAFNAHRGTLLTSGVEHIDWNALSVCTNGACDGHSFRFTETFAGYIPITKTIRLAAEIRLGLNVQTTGGSTTYPDRLFFLGGEDSIRGWLQDTFVPQDYVDRIAQSANPIQLTGKRVGARAVPWGTLPNAGVNPVFTINDVALRGGNLMVNPRLELRIPIKAPLETVLFGDAANLWSDPLYPFQHLDSFSLRYSAGTGIRLQTPIGPIAVDYGLNLSRLFSSASNIERTYEDPWEFHFAIGLF